MPVSESDKLFLHAAIKLAEKGLYQSPPNPSVGCLLVKDTNIVGRGFTQYAGGNHAEIEALQNARANSADVKGATAYVSLEPCCIDGRTPPCTKALIASGIQRVVCAATDPNPRIAGRGIQHLKDAGVATELVEMDQAANMNPGFNKRMLRHLPWVRVKSAMSMDGRTAMASGESQWITGKAARGDVQHWRARSGAILTGSGTILADNPRLTVRGARFASTGIHPSGEAGTDIRQPLRIVLDSQLRCAPSAVVFDQSSPSMVITLASADAERLQAFEDLPNTRVFVQNTGKIDLQHVLAELARMEINEVLVEAGAGVTGSFFENGLWDEALIYVAPKLMGQSAMPLAGIALDKMADAFTFSFKDVTRLDKDIRIRALNPNA